MKDRTKTLLTALVGYVLGACIMLPAAREFMQVTVKIAPPMDAADAYLAANRATVESMVMEDVKRYGVDVYRLYLEISQALPGMPGADFAVDKAVKKLAVTYPDSNVRRIADAYVVYGAIRKRDMLQIEQYLLTAEQSGQKLLMPNGYEIVPQLVTAQYNYYFHTGRFAEAGKTLDYLSAKFLDSFIFQPQGKPLKVTDFVDSQRRVLELAIRKEAK